MSSQIGNLSGNAFEDIILPEPDLVARCAHSTHPYAPVPWQELPISHRVLIPRAISNRPELESNQADLLLRAEALCVEARAMPCQIIPPTPTDSLRIQELASQYEQPTLRTQNVHKKPWSAWHSLPTASIYESKELASCRASVPWWAQEMPIESNVSVHAQNCPTIVPLNERCVNREHSQHKQDGQVALEWIAFTFFILILVCVASVIFFMNPTLKCQPLLTAIVALIVAIFALLLFHIVASVRKIGCKC